MGDPFIPPEKNQGELLRFDRGEMSVSSRSLLPGGNLRFLDFVKEIWLRIRSLPNTESLFDEIHSLLTMPFQLGLAFLLFLTSFLSSLSLNGFKCIFHIDVVVHDDSDAASVSTPVRRSN